MVKYKYQIGQTVKVAPVISKEEWDKKYRGHIVWNYGGMKTKDFCGKTVTIKNKTKHCWGLCYEVQDEKGNETWIFEDSLLPPSREELVKNLLNGQIDVPNFNNLIKVVESDG